MSSHTPTRYRRVNRDHETDPGVIRDALPPDRRLARGRTEPLDALERNLEYAYLTARRRRSVRAVLVVLVDLADWDSMASRPGWSTIGQRARVSRRTVARALADLELWGVIVRVAGGRRAEYAARGVDGGRVNEAAVYALTVPLEAPVESFGTPPGVSGHLGRSKPTRARTCEATWGLYAPIRRKRDRLWAAARLRALAPPLACLGDRALASALRPWAKAGWVLADVLHALDWLPDGSPSPYGPPPLGAMHPRRAAGWLEHRLDAWKGPDGRPLPSREGARAAARAEQLHGQALAARQARREALERAQAARTASPVRQDALAAIKASFEAVRGLWGRPRGAGPVVGAARC